MSGCGISWAICKSAPRSRQITRQHPPLSFFTGRMPFLPPNQQRQSTEGRALYQPLLKSYLIWFVMQAVSWSDRVTSISDAGHRAAVFPRSHNQTAAESISAERVGPRGRAVHAADHLQLLAESPQQDVRHDPVLAEPDSILASSGVALHCFCPRNWGTGGGGQGGDRYPPNEVPSSFSAVLAPMGAKGPTVYVYGPCSKAQQPLSTLYISTTFTRHWRRDVIMLMPISDAQVLPKPHGPVGQLWSPFP